MQIIDYLKQHKIYLIFFGGFFLLISLIVYTSALFKPIAPRVQEPTISQDLLLRVVRHTPPQGPRSTVDKLEPIEFEFSEPVNTASIVYRVNPFIEMRLLQNPETPHIVVFVPYTPGWNPDVAYTLTIISARSAVGRHALLEPVIYEYFNRFPTPQEIDTWYEDGSHFTDTL